MDNENLEIENDVVDETTEVVADEVATDEVVQEETDIEVTETTEAPAEEIVTEETSTDEYEDYFADDKEEEETLSVAKVPEKKHLIKNKIVREIVSWACTIIAAIAIAIVINTYFFRISRVSGQSMEQTYHNKDVVYLTRLPYIFGDIEKNEIVIFDSSFKERNFITDIVEALKYNAISYKLFGTEQPTSYYIKRVIAVAGDTIQIKENGVYVNGKLLDEPYVNNKEAPYYGNVSDELKKGVTVPDGKIFVMGDNRNHSADSRQLGFIPVNDVIGKVIGT